MVGAEPVFTFLQDIVESVIGNIIARFENFFEIIGNIVTIIDALLKGDLDTVMTEMQDLFKNIVEGIILQIIMIPAAFNDIIAELGGAILTGMRDAGQFLIEAFIEGMQTAIEAAAGLVATFLELIAGFFGGSLPERGPLQFIDKMGMELGESYIANIGAGMTAGAAKMGDTISKSVSIGNLNMYVSGSDMTSSSRFLGRLDSDVNRRGTAW